LTRGAPSGPRNMQPTKSPASNPSYISETSLGHSLMPALNRVSVPASPPRSPSLPHSLSPSRGLAAPRRRSGLRPSRTAAARPRPQPGAAHQARPRPDGRPRRHLHPRLRDLAELASLADLPTSRGESSSPAGRTTHPFPRSHLPSGRNPFYPPVPPANPAVQPRLKMASGQGRDGLL
jgi:hypothetical protein